MTPLKPSKPPPVSLDSLTAPTRAWVERVVAEFELPEHALRLLVLAGGALDRAEEARAAVARDGAYLPNRFGELRAHPGIAVERDAKTTFARLTREVGLDLAPETPPRPPPVTGGARYGRGGS